MLGATTGMTNETGTMNPDSAPDFLADSELMYVSDEDAGFTRLKRGRGFSYRDCDGEVVRDGEELARLKALVIPPAWTDVWICADPNGHILATGFLYEFGKSL